MSEQATEAKSVERKKAGRPPSIDLDDLRNAIDRIEASGKLASAGAVQGVIGGSRKTIERLMEEIGYLDSTINTQSPTPLAIDKVWQQCLNEHSLAIRAECQAKLNEMRKLLQRAVDALLCMEASFDQADKDRAQAWQERDELKGQLAIEREARTRCEAELVVAREKAELSSKSEAVIGAKLEASLLTVQALEADAAQHHRQYKAREDELVRARADLHAAELQAEQYRQDQVQLEAEHDVELRVNAHHFEKMYAILEHLADQYPQALATIKDLQADTPEDESVPTSRFGTVLGLLTRKKASPPLPPEELNPPDSIIPF